MHPDHLNQCSQCQFTTCRLIDLKYHIKSVHDKNKDILCSKCGYTCYRKTELNRHVKKVHEQIFDQFCDGCDFSCATKRQMKAHNSKTCTNYNPNKRTRKLKNKNLGIENIEFSDEECRVVEEVTFELP